MQRLNENEDSEVFEEYGLVDKAIDEYFSEIYKRFDHLQTQSAETKQVDDTEMIDEMIASVEESTDTTAMISVEDIREATKQSNFNKGLGPDCFDGNLLN